MTDLGKAPVYRTVADTKPEDAPTIDKPTGFPARDQNGENQFFGTDNPQCKGQDFAQVQGRRFVACNVQKFALAKLFRDNLIGYLQGYFYSIVDTPPKANYTLETQPKVRTAIKVSKPTA